MKNRYTLITGGSEGIGLELAKLFANDKHNLVIVARDRLKLERVRKTLEERYEVKVIVYDLDLSLKDSCDKLINYIKSEELIINNLINNVGIGSFGLFCEGSNGLEDKIIDINIRSLTILTKHFINEMIERGEGRILNVASTAAFIGGPKMALYYATKAYVLSLTEALYEEVKDFGVQVSCLCPGPVKTSFQEKAGIKKSESSKKFLMDPYLVAEVAYRDFNKNKCIIIPGLKNKLAVIGNKFLPRSLCRKIILRNNID